MIKKEDAKIGTHVIHDTVGEAIIRTAVGATGEPIVGIEVTKTLPTNNNLGGAITSGRGWYAKLSKLTLIQQDCDS